MSSNQFVSCKTVTVALGQSGQATRITRTDQWIGWLNLAPNPDLFRQDEYRGRFMVWYERIVVFFLCLCELYWVSTHIWANYIHFSYKYDELIWFVIWWIKDLYTIFIKQYNLIDRVNILILTDKLLTISFNILSKYTCFKKFKHM